MTSAETYKSGGKIGMGIEGVCTHLKFQHFLNLNTHLIEIFVIFVIKTKNIMNFKEIYNIAKSQLEGISDVEKPDFRLEQAEYKKKDKVWEVVVSYLVDRNYVEKKNLSSIFETAYNNSFERVYKTVKINENNEVLGFYMYQS